jgi:hypothetical protein
MNTNSWCAVDIIDTKNGIYNECRVKINTKVFKRADKLRKIT